MDLMSQEGHPLRRFARPRLGHGRFHAGWQPLRDLPRGLVRDEPGPIHIHDHIGTVMLDSLKAAEKDNEISQDEHHDYAGEIQELTDTYVGKIDELLDKKEQDIKQV